MCQNHWKIFDLSERDREYLLLDEKKFVVWISYKLRKEISSAGLPKSHFLGCHIDDIRNYLPQKDSNLRRSLIELCNGVSEVNLSGRCLLKAERENKTDRLAR